MLSIRRYLLALCVSCTLAIVAAGAGWAQKLDYGHAVQAGEIMVADADYSHFPRLARGQGGRLGVLYYRGYNHGSGDNQGIARSQKPHGSGPLQLAIDGTHARGGAAELPVAGQLIISVEKDETARRFTVIGEDRDGRRVEETVAGPAAKRAYTRQRFKRVTSIAIDGAPAGRVSVGPRVVPSNMEFRYSDNGGESWSGATVLADGIGSDDTFYYVGALAGLPDGTFMAVYVRVNPDTGRTDSLRRVSTDNGVTWSKAEPIQFTGANPRTTFRLWGQIQSTPSGKLVAMAYAGEENWALVSSDLGRTWVAHLIVRTPPDTDYNEMAVAIVSENDWITIARGATRGQGGSSMRQFVTRDGGKTWADLGGTNADWSGGYVSPAMQTMRCGSRTTVVWVYMARASRSSPPPTPNSLIVRFAPAEAALESAKVWSAQSIVGHVGSFTHRSGYPSIAMNETCSGGVIVAGRETSETTAGIVAMKWTIPADLLSKMRGR